MLLPKRMDTPPARVMILAIGLQESRFKHRRQMVGSPPKPIGPAAGFWQFERGGGCASVLAHRASGHWMRAVCAERKVEPTSLALWEALQRDDVLAAAAARLLLWTDPRPLPAIGEVDDAWDYYIRNWRPGKPHRETWDEQYRTAVWHVTGDNA